MFLPAKTPYRSQRTPYVANNSTIEFSRVGEKQVEHLRQYIKAVRPQNVSTPSSDQSSNNPIALKCNSKTQHCSYTQPALHDAQHSWLNVRGTAKVIQHKLNLKKYPTVLDNISNISSAESTDKSCAQMTLTEHLHNSGLGFRNQEKLSIYIPNPLQSFASTEDSDGSSTVSDKTGESARDVPS